MSKSDGSCVIHLAEAQASIPGPAGEHAISFLQRGTLNAMLSLGRFAPLPRPTTPHAQDEVYVVMHGRGVFFHDGKRDSFEAGDLLFVARSPPPRSGGQTHQISLGVDTRRQHVGP